ncbi:MAG TPA: CRISPR-associated endonuclease Cas1 [Dehalococcoidia bacterium]|nr:CRISPR-associated endonuclease Cas1 [Dehalococcoidia bacterium]
MPNLYVTELGSVVEKEAEQLLVTKGSEVRPAVPARRIEQVVLVGPVGVTTPALDFLLDRGIGLVLLTARGEFRGRLAGDLSRHVALRHRQHQRADDAAFGLGIGRAIVAGKIHNSRTLCLRWDETNDDPTTLAATRELRTLEEGAGRAPGIATLMGIEGRAARLYFGELGRRLRAPWCFTNRARRPPPDPVNALLSICYTLLHESCYAALEAAGLDPFCGFLHQPRYGRASLALDLMEEFRPLIADLVVMRLANLRRLAPGDFQPEPGPRVRLSRDGWRVVAEEYNRRLQTLVGVPGARRRTTYQRLLEVQARHLRHAIEGAAPTYEPFRAR